MFCPCGNPSPTTLKSDLSEALSDFNGEMTTAYRVTGTLEPPVGMEEGKGEITGWETVEGGDASAEM